MKKRYFNRLHILITAALLLAPSIANGQEYIRSLLTLNGKNSIIRNVDNDKKLVYSYNNEIVTFTMYKENSPTVDAMNFTLGEGHSVRIHDFVIHEDTVYFGGTDIIADEEEDVYMALMGYFSLTDFPNSTIYLLNNLMNGTITRIDAFSELLSPNYTHVVMTLDSPLANSILDAVRTPTWFMYWGDDINYPIHFDDIETTDSYVIVSSRTGGLTDTLHELRFYGKSIAGGQTFFDNYSGHLKYPLTQNHTRVLIEHCTLDGFVTVTSDWFGNFVVRGYNAMTPLCSLKLFTLNSLLFYPGDVKYNSHDLSINILGNYPSISTMSLRTNLSSVIYKLDVSHLMGNTVVDCRSYSSYNTNTIYSLEYIPSPYNVFMGSGSNSHSSSLKVYKYTDPNYWECSEFSSIECKKIEEEPQPVNRKTNYEMTKPALRETDSWSEAIEVESFCN